MANYSAQRKIQEPLPSQELPSHSILDSDESGTRTLSDTAIPHRRLFGAYYTPDDVAELLTRWAIDEEADNVLDPSFGGCAFMQAAAKLMAKSGRPGAGRKVFGVDVDPSCVKFVRDNPDLFEGNCVFGDFLALRPADLAGAPFQAIVGNPPYVRHHWLKNDRRAAARRIASNSGLNLPETASLWAYFVLHGLNFLRPGGRMALLVPEAILQADYASVVRAALQLSFTKVRLIHLRQRLFAGTDEPVVAIAAEGFGMAGRLEVHSVETTGELDNLLRGISRLQSLTTLHNGRRVSSGVLNQVAKISELPSVRRFGDLATTHIGIVTGANSHFIRGREELNALGVPARARLAIVSRTKWLSGLDFTAADHQEVAQAGARAFLVRPTPDVLSEPGVVSWIKEGEDAEHHYRHKCQKREPWFKINLPPRPDAFVTSTRLGQPRFVINRGNFRCTNSLYASTWNPQFDTAPEVVALGFLTTFVALWSELNGRRYGGGVLKMDLTTLGRLPVPVVPDALEAFEAVDSALRNGNESEARRLADEAVLVRGLRSTASNLKAMRTALAELTRQRIPSTDG